MIVLPSIAFDAFAGTAKDVTARRVGGRTVLSVRATHSAFFTPAQAVSRNRLSRISRAYRTLSDAERAGWEQLAQRYTATSSLGKGAVLSAHNMFVRLNCNLVMVGGSPITAAPIGLDQVPQVLLTAMYVSSSSVRIEGIEEPNDGLRLVVKMSGAQSVGVSSAWSKTVVVSSSEETDWGELDLTEAFAEVLGVEVEDGKKFFVELYWADSRTGFTGQVTRISGIAGPAPIYGGSVPSNRAIIRVRDYTTEDQCVFKGFEYELSRGSVIGSCRGSYGYHGSQVNGYAPLDPQTASKFAAHQGYFLARGNAGKHWTINFVEVEVRDVSGEPNLIVLPELDYDVFGCELFDVAAPVNY